MDRITKSYLDAFRDEQSLADVPESDLFELFANYCVVADVYDEAFDVNDVHVGGGQDLGLDGIAVIANGALVTSVEEVQDLIKVNGYLDVKFVLVQAKTSSGFDGSDMGTFFDGVDEFFAESPTLPMSARVADAHTLMSAIYENSIAFRRAKPTCDLFYVTTGQWTNDPYLSEKAAKRVEALRATGLFADVHFHPMGADELHASYQRSKNSVTAEFNFANKVVLSDIVGVAQSYLGVVPAVEFLRLITDHAGNIRKSLFYDNIRDFQDYNPVNNEIRTTLSDQHGQERFAVLNNGVTIVARELRTTGNKFVITDYQIVNGCQTSHVLFDAASELGDKVEVPVKVVATNDEEIIAAIITATNRQTQVSTEDLYALSSFQKKLEQLFGSYPDKKKLYYERRSKQYNSIAGIEKVRIISKPQQIRAFAAMFLDEPHRASRYYADLRGLVGSKIFHEAHKLDPYYASAYSYYKLEYLFRNGLLGNFYKPSRYHLLMAARYAIAGEDMPSFSANKVQTYCSKVCDAMWSDDDALDAFKVGIAAVDSVLDGATLTRDTVKTQTFTDAVKSAMGIAQQRSPKGDSDAADPGGGS